MTKRICIFLLLDFVSLIGYSRAQCTSNKTYENKCYKLYNTGTTWHKAKEYCSNLEGNWILTKVFSKSELTFLNNYLKVQLNQVWLGATDELQEGKWVWADGTEANLTSLWEGYEPNNRNGIEDCLELDYYGRLNDAACNSSLAVICMGTNGTTTKSKTAPSSVTSTGTTATSSNTNEKINSLGLIEWIGIGTGIGVVVTLSVLAVVLAIKCRRKTPSSEQKILYDNVKSTKGGCIGLRHVELNEYETEHMYQTCLDGRSVL